MSDDNLTSVPQAPIAADARIEPEPAGEVHSFALQRRVYAPSRSAGVADWIAFVLAFLVAPLGVLAGIAAIVLGRRTNGWASGVAKAAVGIGVVVSVALGGGYALFANVQQKQAAHDAVIASSARWCSELQSTPGVLQSPTFGWPAPQGTVSQSLVAIEQYSARWTDLEKLAPAGIRSGTASIAKSAAAIAANVSTSQVLDDDSNESQMAGVVASSGVAAWVSQYCK